MKSLQERITDVSTYLQSLLNPTVFPKVQEAVEKQDRTMLIEACRTAKIPDIYLSSVASIILSVQPKKWPDIY